MTRTTGTYRTTTVGGENVRAFIPHPLPHANPKLDLNESLTALHGEALAAISRLNVAGAMVPSPGWFLYGFIRKEAVISSQIEGTQATLEDIVSFEATSHADRPADVEEVYHYVEALTYARQELGKPKGLPVCTRLLCELHTRLISGTRGSESNLASSAPHRTGLAAPGPEMPVLFQRRRKRSAKRRERWSVGCMTQIRCRPWCAPVWLTCNSRPSTRFSMAMVASGDC